MKRSRRSAAVAIIGLSDRVRERCPYGDDVEWADSEDLVHAPFSRQMVNAFSAWCTGVATRSCWCSITPTNAATLWRAAVEQQRPDVFVFAVVVMVQHRHQRPDVIADDVRAAVIARRDTERQSGQQRELAPQHCPAPRPSRGRRKLRRLLVSATELSESLSGAKGSRMLDSPLNILPVANGIEWPLTLGVGWF